MTNYLVKPSLLPRLARATISLLAVAAWLLAANHCVVAGFLPKANTVSSEHAPCPAHKAPAPEKKSKDCDGSSCCKSLSAPLALAKNLVGYDLASFDACEFPGSATEAAGCQHEPAILALDTGPPDGLSFAESVLQRSILAHAPPVVA
ncbi:MAG TPA: hypothetical protein VF551_06330 [Chthoniobacterales bacterium]